MSLEVPTYLGADPTFRALVEDVDGTVRIFNDVVPQDTRRPYVTWSAVFGADENYLSGAADMTNRRVQVDVWGDTEQQARVTAAAAFDVLSRHGYRLSINFEGQRDDETGLRRYGDDWSFWTPRA